MNKKHQKKQIIILGFLFFFFSIITIDFIKINVYEFLVLLNFTKESMDTLAHSILIFGFMINFIVFRKCKESCYVVLYGVIITVMSSVYFMLIIKNLF